MVPLIVTLVWHRFFKSMWKGFSTEFNSILKNLGRHKSFLDSCVQFSYMEASNDTLVRLEAEVAAQFRRYQDDLDHIRAQLTSLLKDEEQKQLNNVREWLAVESRSMIDHEVYQKVRSEHLSTTNWILNHDTIRDWIVSDNPNTALLWMHGIPGAGTHFVIYDRDVTPLIKSRQDHSRVQNYRPMYTEDRLRHKFLLLSRWRSDQQHCDGYSKGACGLFPPRQRFVTADMLCKTQRQQRTHPSS